MKRIRSAVAATFVAGSVLAGLASPVVAGSGATGFTGHWTTVDCAQWWEEPHVVNCDLWGDNSQLTLGIGPGATPAAVFQDSYASVCANNGSRSTRWIAAGTGEYSDFLYLTFTKSGCGTFGMGGYAGNVLYHDPGSDTLWEDPDGDGWGYVWHRIP